MAVVMCGGEIPKASEAPPRKALPGRQDHTNTESPQINSKLHCMCSEGHGACGACAKKAAS